MRRHEYFVYIITNKNKTVLYTGVTNSLESRLEDHYFNQGKKKTFAGRYNCHFLIHHEFFHDVNEAIRREKEIKKLSRQKKEDLINTLNPEWKFLNEEIMAWPPPER